jgi:hypothetical protein
MLNLIRNRPGLALAAIVGLVCPLLMAPSGGFPSNPAFQTVTIKGSGTPLSVPNGSAFVGGSSTAGSLVVGSPTGGVLGGGTVNSQTGYFVNNVAIPPPIMCTTACSVAGMLIGQTAIVAKGTNTSRISVATTSADPDLQFTSAPAGQYAISFFLDQSGGAGGFRYVLTGAGNNNGLQGTMSCAGGVGDVATHVIALNATQCNATSGGFASLAGAVTTNASGVISLDWGQATSTASNSTMLNDSWIEITRIK